MRIRAKWGKENKNYRNFNQIRRYLKITQPESFISGETADDLATEDLFSFIDRTNSKPGQQLLFKRLHYFLSETDFSDQEERINSLCEDDQLRENIELKLSSLNNDDAYYLPELYNGPHQSHFHYLVEQYIKVSPILVFILIGIIATVPNGAVFLTLLTLLLINTGIHFFNKKYIFKYTHSLPQLLILCDTGLWLQKQNCFVKNDDIDPSLKRISKLKRTLGMIYFQNKDVNDPTDVIYLIKEWFRMLLLFEPLIFLFAIKRVNRYLNDIKILHEAVAEVDLSISIQSVRTGLPYYCLPDFSSDSSLNIEDIYHPLVENCVPNSITANNSQVVLITGSNMSGKTTFIRSVAINTLLAQCINTCCAKSYQAPKLQILTSIHMSDDLDAGQSYFQAEALSILDIINKSSDSNAIKNLIIVDEIFRGTNTIERIAAARAVLNHLIVRKNFVFVSTHDLELAELLGDENVVYSFEEAVTDQGLAFDYKIKTGMLKNKNGIAVLKNLGYPQSIVDLAQQTSRHLRKKYNMN